MRGYQPYLRHGGPFCELLDAFPNVWVRKNIPAAILDACSPKAASVVDMGVRCQIEENAWHCGDEERPMLRSTTAKHRVGDLHGGRTIGIEYPASHVAEPALGRLWHTLPCTP